MPYYNQDPEEYRNDGKVHKKLSTIFTYTRNMRISLTSILIYHLQHINNKYVWSHNAACSPSRLPLCFSL